MGLFEEVNSLLILKQVCLERAMSFLRGLRKRVSSNLVLCWLNERRDVITIERTVQK